MRAGEQHRDARAGTASTRAQPSQSPDLIHDRIWRSSAPSPKPYPLPDCSPSYAFPSPGNAQRVSEPVRPCPAAIACLVEQRTSSTPGLGDIIPPPLGSLARLRWDGTSCERAPVWGHVRHPWPDSDDVAGHDSKRSIYVVMYMPMSSRSRTALMGWWAKSTSPNRDPLRTLELSASHHWPPVRVSSQRLASLPRVRGPAWCR